LGGPSHYYAGLDRSLSARLKADPIKKSGLRESARERYHRSMSGRGFPSPWTVEDDDACFIVRDANGQALGYFYFEEDHGRRSTANLLTKEEARRIAVNFARLPELLRSQPYWR
jgi:hypothetical protein